MSFIYPVRTHRVPTVRVLESLTASNEALVSSLVRVGDVLILAQLAESATPSPLTDGFESLMTETLLVRSVRISVKVATLADIGRDYVDFSRLGVFRSDVGQPLTYSLLEPGSIDPSVYPLPCAFAWTAVNDDSSVPATGTLDEEGPFGTYGQGWGDTSYRISGWTGLVWPGTITIRNGAPSSSRQWLAIHRA